MTLHVLFDPKDEAAVMVCGVQDLAFGPVVWGPAGPALLNAFCDWIGADPRQFQPHRLDMLFAAFQSSEEFATIVAGQAPDITPTVAPAAPDAIPDETGVPAPVDANPTADTVSTVVVGSVACGVCDGAGTLLDGGACPACDGSGIDPILTAPLPAGS